MAINAYFSRRTNRQTVSRLDSGFVFQNSFGTYGTAQTDNTGLNFPWGIANDPAGNIYVCDGKNNRIVKLTSALVYTSSVDVSATVGVPYAIFYDTTNSELYVAGIYNYVTISVARITTALSITKSDSDIYPADTNDQPMGISRGFGGSDFLISGGLDLLNVTEGVGDFGTASTQAITGETGTKFVGHVQHSNGFLYLITESQDGSKILRVNSSYINTGDSNTVSSTAFLLTEDHNTYMLTFDAHNKKIVRYDENLNYVDDVFVDTGDTDSTDCEEVFGIILNNVF